MANFAEKSMFISTRSSSVTEIGSLEVLHFVKPQHVNYDNVDFFDGEILILNATTLKIRLSDGASVIHVVQLVRK